MIARAIPGAVSAVLMLSFTAPALAEGWTYGTAIVSTDTGQHHFTVEIADEPAERAKGLMHRTALAERSGMIFVYDPPQESTFWMKNTPLPLDIIFADSRGVIIEIAAETTPFSLELIPSGGDAALVLELAGGSAGAIGIETGDHLSLIE